MSSNFQGRSQQKMSNYRQESNNNYYENEPRYSDSIREANNPNDFDESRLVTITPDANLKISVHNDYRDRGYGRSRGILKSHSYRDGETYNDSYERNSYHANRGFDNYGRGRGVSRGFSPRNDTSNNDYRHNNTPRGINPRQVVETREKYEDDNPGIDNIGKELPRSSDNDHGTGGNQRGFGNRQSRNFYPRYHNQDRPYQNRQFSDSHDDRVDRSYHGQEASDGGNKEADYSHDRGYQDRQSTDNYRHNQDQYIPRDHFNSRNFRGRGRFSNGRSRRGQGRGGRDRGSNNRHMDNNDDCIAGKNNDPSVDDGAAWLESDNRDDCVTNIDQCQADR